MKKNNFTFGGGKYSAPEIELYSAQVENGFQGSITPISIDAWNEEGDENALGC